MPCAGMVFGTQCVKSLLPSGKVMGTDVRAWFAEDPSANLAASKRRGSTQVQQSAPFANGDMMDQYDRRTFGPKLTLKTWDKTLKSLEAASTKLGEVERGLILGLKSAQSITGGSATARTVSSMSRGTTRSNAASGAVSEEGGASNASEALVRGVKPGMNGLLQTSGVRRWLDSASGDPDDGERASVAGVRARTRGGSKGRAGGEGAGAGAGAGAGSLSGSARGAGWGSRSARGSGGSIASGRMSVNVGQRDGRGGGASDRNGGAKEGGRPHTAREMPKFDDVFRRTNMGNTTFEAMYGYQARSVCSPQPSTPFFLFPNSWFGAQWRGRE